MARQRPGSVTAMGILNIIFGSIFTLACLCNAGGMAMNLSGANRGDPNVEFAEQLMAEVPGYMPVQVGSLIINLTLSVLLLVAGIGLLNMKGWGRGLSIFYGIANVLMQVGSLIYYFAFLNPIMDRIMREVFGPQLRGGPDPGTMVRILNVVMVIIYFVLMLYGIILLIMMLTPKVSAAFRGAGEAPGYGGERYDEADDYERRRRREDEGWGA